MSCADGADTSLGEEQLPSVSNVENWLDDLCFFIHRTFFAGLLESIVPSIFRYLFESLLDSDWDGMVLKCVSKDNRFSIFKIQIKIFNNYKKKCTVWTKNEFLFISYCIVILFFK